MGKKRLTLEQQKADVDIWNIFLISLGSFIIYMNFGDEIISFIKNPENSIVARLLLNASIQFGFAGLGISLVCYFRKEPFSKFGLVKENVIRAILLSILCYIPYIFYIFISGQFDGYKPFSILLTSDVLESGLPFNIIGMLLIILVWGFFEGFNYVVISDKLNILFPLNSKWINIGALFSAVFGILIHPLSLSFWGIIEIVTTFIALYGMLLVKNRTNNAWGVIFVFCLIWNAF